MRSSATVYSHGGNEKQEPHFLDSCFLCQRQIAHNCDIFMYRGNTPFCSQECRQEQIEIDEANERRRKPSSTSRNSADSRKASKPNKTGRTGVVVMA